MGTQKPIPLQTTKTQSLAMTNKAPSLQGAPSNKKSAK